MQFDKDKIGHTIVGVAVSVVAFLYDPLWVCPALVAVAFGKELYDARHPDKHTADVADALVTVGAGFIATYALAWGQFFLR